MKRLVSFLLGGVLIMTGMYCKKDAREEGGSTTGDLAIQMSRDPEFVQLFRGMVHYNDFVGASGQVTRFASLVRDETSFKQAAQKNLDEMVLRFPKEEEVSLLELSTRIQRRYGLKDLAVADGQTLVRKAMDILDPPGGNSALAVSSHARSEISCWDKLILQESRCDRDMALGSLEAVLLGSVGVLSATGVGIPIAASLMGVGLTFKWIRHSNCINDALKDYKACSNP